MALCDNEGAREALEEASLMSAEDDSSDGRLRLFEVAAVELADEGAATVPGVLSIGKTSVVEVVVGFGMVLMALTSAIRNLRTSEVCTDADGC